MRLEGEFKPAAKIEKVKSPKVKAKRSINPTYKKQGPDSAIKLQSSDNQSTSCETFESEDESDAESKAETKTESKTEFKTESKDESEDESTESEDETEDESKDESKYSHLVKGNKRIHTEEEPFAAGFFKQFKSK